MANRLASILQQEYKTKGLVGGTASAVGKAAKEKLDIRNALFSGEGIGSVIGTKIFGKGYSATKREKTRTQKSTSPESLSSSLSSGESPVLQEMNANMKLTAKNSMSLPMMARDMNLMKLNIFKLVKSFGDKPNTNKTDMFYEKSKIRNAAYNNTIGKMMGKGRLGTLSKSVFVSKKERDGQTPETALYITGGSGGDTDETSLIGGILTSMGKSAAIARMATLAGAVVSSPLFLTAAAVGSIFLAKKLRDDEIASDPEKYKDVASVRAKREGVTNKTAGARNAAEARTGSLTQGDADGIIQTLIKEKMFGISAENFIREYYPNNPEITLQTILNICDPKLKEEYQKMLAANMPPAPPASPAPTVLPTSPAGAGRGLVNPENVSPTPQTQSDIPSNVIRSGSGAPIMTGSGGYVTSGESPSPMLSSAATSKTSPSPVSSGGSTSSYIQKASEMIVKEEGLPKGGKAYFDPPGQKQLVSIGYGHQIKDSEYKSGFIQAGNESIPISGERGIDTVMSKTQSQKLLEMDLPKYEQAAAAPLGEAWSKLNDEQKASLISYAYNTGGTASLVKRGLKDAIMAGDFSKAGNIISEKGIRTAGGVENATLVKRRQHEGALFASSGSSSPSTSPSKPSSGSAVASASTSVSDQKMAAMIPTGGQTTVVNGGPITVGSSKSGSRVSPFQKEFHDKIISAIALT